MSSAPSAPRFLLLHGAGTGPWVWDRVLEHLDAPALTPDAPWRTAGMTPDSCAAELVRDLDAHGVTRVVPVLHSLAGVLVWDLARRLGDRLVHCILVGAVVPPPGHAFIHAMPLPNRIILRVLFRLNRNGLRPSADMIRRELCNDLTPEDTERVISQYQAELPGLFLENTGAAAPLPPTTYVRLLNDHSVPPSLQDSMIARVPGARVHELDAGHLVMLSRPDALAGIIAGASPARGVTGH